jgi:hypothetical protein
VELQDGSRLTSLDSSTRSEDAKRQRAAANDFLNLAKVHLTNELPSVEVVDYYLYRGPSKSKLERNEFEFDSALRPGEEVTEEGMRKVENPRQAYCVLALGKKQGCPATSGTKPAIASTVTTTSGTVGLSVNPEGLATKYFVEYGTTTAYGDTTTATDTVNEAGEQSETVTLSGLAPCTTYHYQAEAENEANDGIASLGGDETFTTHCEEAPEAPYLLAEFGDASPTISEEYESFWLPFHVVADNEIPTEANWSWHVEGAHSGIYSIYYYGYIENSGKKTGMLSARLLKREPFAEGEILAEVAPTELAPGDRTLIDISIEPYLSHVTGEQIVLDVFTAKLERISYGGESLGGTIAVKEIG